MNSNLTQQPIENNADFMIGDAVVLDESGAFESFDDLCYVIEVYEHMVCVLIRFGTLTLSKKLVRNASVAEVLAKRRLTTAEQALAEVP
ncbi:hypothetical protein C9E88_013020 [Acinetobacter cumulans]|uniref:hypothetical protein n=1 Tax=Acinetobacter cumulans TaxID=2136182 RepID=UPI000D11913E|nr:hypothetical protein [Acinetobacter cumulans]QCO22340.1 hypothetical protein C9E88_013020 [Acinetobacter cumulans]